jgi:hypothetical protein
MAKQVISILSQHRINSFDYTKTAVYSTLVGKAVIMASDFSFVLFKERRFNRFSVLFDVLD